MQLTRQTSNRQTLSIIAIAFTLIVTSINQSRAGDWLHDYDAAQKLAQEKDLPLLLHFHADWCGPCQQMNRTVLHTQSVTKLFGQRVIAVKIDSDQYPQIVSRFNVQSLPSDVLLTPTGRIISRTDGMQPRSTYLSFLGRGASRYENDRRVYLAQKSKKQLMPRKPQNDTESAEEDDTIENQFAPQEPKSYVAKMPSKIGLEGYSPVSLTRDRKWTKGEEQYSWPYQGITYLLASKTELELFKLDPGRYAPQLLGCDPVILNKQDRAIPGNTKYGAYYDQNLYLFVDIESREEFKKNPDRFSRTMHVLKFKLSKDTVIR